MVKKKSFSIRQLVGAVLVVVAAGLVFTACKKSNDGPAVNPAAAGLMAFNLAVDKPSVGISLSGSNLLSAPLAYAGYTGTYLSIYPGNRTVEASDNGNMPFASTAFSFDTSKYYSAFVVGGNGNYSNLVVADNLDTLPAGSQQAFIRYVNAIPDSSKPQVSIKAGGNNVIDMVAAYKTVSGFVPVMPGDISIAVNNEGNINASRTITVAEKKVYTILLLGNPAGTDSTSRPQIRFIQNGSL